MQRRRCRRRQLSGVAQQAQEQQQQQQQQELQQQAQEQRRRQPVELDLAAWANTLLFLVGLILVEFGVCDLLGDSVWGSILCVACGLCINLSIPDLAMSRALGGPPSLPPRLPPQHRKTVMWPLLRPARLPPPLPRLPHPKSQTAVLSTVAPPVHPQSDNAMIHLIHVLHYSLQQLGSKMMASAAGLVHVSRLSSSGPSSRRLPPPRTSSGQPQLRLVVKHQLRLSSLAAALPAQRQQAGLVAASTCLQGCRLVVLLVPGWCQAGARLVPGS
jgi:hypothetical protein